MGQRTGLVRVGISGWNYGPWRGVFYPRGLAHKRELAYAAGQFRTIEINATFYSLQRSETFARWHDETPDDFVFAVKGSRFITHMLRLRGIDVALANFFASGLLRLGAKLGPLLWQFPERMAFDEPLFDAFLSQLPRNAASAAELAAGHDSRIKGQAWLSVESTMPLRHAVEVRHDSFRDPAFINLLRKHHIALVCADTVDWPLLGDLTTDFVYCRLHGSEELYVSGYDDDAIDRWGRRVRTWARGGEPRDLDRVLPAAPPRAGGRDVYVYFDNDAKVRAPFDAQRLYARVNRRRAG